jgi:hypothetical protein
MGVEDGNDVEGISECAKLTVRLVCVHLEDLMSVIFPAASGHVPAILGMVN